MDGGGQGADRRPRVGAVEDPAADGESAAAGVHREMREIGEAAAVARAADQDLGVAVGGVRSAGAEVDYQGGAVEQARLDGAGAPLVDDDGVGAGGHHIADEAAESGGVGYRSVGHGMIHGHDEKFSVA